MRDQSVSNLNIRVQAGQVSVIDPATYVGADRVTISHGDGQPYDQAVVAVRQGDDLVLIYADGTQVIVEDYFLNTSTVAIEDASGLAELAPSSDPIGVVEGVSLYGYDGSIDQARAILVDNPLYARLEPFLSDDATGFVLANDAGFSGGLAGGLGLLALGAAAGGGAAAAAVVGTTVITGSFVAGPVVPGNGLVVDIYDAQGQLIQANVPIDANGSFSVTLQGTFPNVIAILRDTNTDPDYRDEATGANVDLNASLAGIGAGTPQPGGTTNVSLNINPVTTVAARLAGVGSDGTIPPGGISAEKIAQSLQTVQNSFGLPDINSVPPVNIFDDSFDDTDGNVSDGEKYG